LCTTVEAFLTQSFFQTLASIGVTKRMQVLQVALDVPLPRLFDYAWPDATAALIGCRVRVPFGKTKRIGIVLGVGESAIAVDKLKSADAVLFDMPPLAEEWLALANFCSEYYQRPLGEVVHGALPPRLKRVVSIERPPEFFRLSAAGAAALETKLRSAAQREMLESLAAGPLPAETLAAGAARRELMKKGWIESCAPERPPLSFHTAVQLNGPQQAACGAVSAKLGEYAPFLLLGVTGSGKTEVYLHLIAATLRRGRQALILVPEINLTPQLEAQFRERLPGARLLTLTSALPDNERAQRWLAAQAGEADIVLGTRLAVFAPLPDIGLIIVDEEHDASFKQQEGVRYSARDLAVFRAHQAGIPVVLGSATPSLETYAQTRAGRYGLLELPERARPGAAQPEVRMIDTWTLASPDGLSAELVEAVETRLAREEQVLLFLNRRGYAPVLSCGACAWVADCPRCSAHLVVHLKDGRLRCHHCGYVAPLPRHCPQCGNVDLVPFGRGTQRLEDAVAARFPHARLLRIDSDSTRNKGVWESMRERITAGEVDLLIGTQILAKGHDFPLLTLVGVLNADAALLAPDYRAPERLFAQLHQVAGRAGRAERPGEVLIQTRYADHPLYRALARHDYKGHAAALLAEREQAGFPPFVYEAVLRAEAREMEAALAFLQGARTLAPPADESITAYDPVPMTLARLNGWERAQMLLQSPSRRALQQYLRVWVEALYAAKNLAKARAVRWHLDVDPIEF
jgi:primosomal protein N' (replication factor Y) (superfamily II helicase)